MDELIQDHGLPANKKSGNIDKSANHLKIDEFGRGSKGVRARKIGTSQPRQNGINLYKRHAAPVKRVADEAAGEAGTARDIPGSMRKSGTVSPSRKARLIFN